MNVIESAREFVKELLEPTDPRRCPYCGRRMTKRHGFYIVTIRDVGGVHQEKVQRYWCHLCRCSYSPPDPRREARARYTRQVRRKALDLYFHVGASVRAAAQWLRSEINQGTERALIWNPLLPLSPPAETTARLSHTSVWRWEQQAAQQVEKQAQQGRWQHLIRFSGALVAAASASYIRGVPTPLHLIADAVTRVGLVVGRLRTESEAVIAGQFRLALAWWALGRRCARARERRSRFLSLCLGSGLALGQTAAQPLSPVAQHQPAPASLRRTSRRRSYGHPPRYAPCRLGCTLPPGSPRSFLSPPKRMVSCPLLAASHSTHRQGPRRSPVAH